MLKSMSNMKFTTKLFIVMISMVIVSILITSFNAIRISKQGLYSLGESAVENIHQSLFNSLLAINENIRSKLNGDLGLLERELKSKGGLLLDDVNLVNFTLTNQETGESFEQELVKFQAGVTYVTGDHTFVDNITAMTGSVASVFQLVDDDKLVQISTTITKENGERQIGHYIPAGSPAFKAIQDGEKYSGTELIEGKWYLTAYMPVYGLMKELMGAIRVGQLMLSEQVRDLVSETKLGPGYFFIYSDNGNYLIHPTMTPQDNIFKNVPAFQNSKDGFIEYLWEGEEKIAFKKRLENWRINLVLTINRADIVAGLDTKMITNSIIVGLLVVIFGLAVTVFVVRTINRPLTKLAEQAVKVGEGDYTIRFSSKVDDAIGQLTNSLGLMVSKGHEMIEDIIKSSGSLSTASHELAEISTQMVGIAESTSEISDETAGNAQEVSDNMNSVSASMEESAVNLDMIASASEEMGTTIQEIAENSSRARKITEEAVDSAQRSRSSIRELGESANAIGSITETITEISEQTNLLALNATIEAARAGEAGRGFAVVANEIKELARETAEATGKIKDAIGGIQSQTSATVNDIEAITTVIDDINEIVSGIVTAVEEQSITTNEIVNNVNQASQGIAEINENIANGNLITATMSEGVGKVKKHTDEVKESSQQVRTSADELSHLAGSLKEVVSKFKI